jgi:hypothetical protein
METTGAIVEAPVPATTVRGGVSIGGAVTGALVAYAAGILFTLTIRAIASYAGYKPYRLLIGGTHGAGLTAAVGIGAGVFLAFLWGGYAAGRMGRGKGWVNGLLSAIVVGLIGAAGFGIATLLRPGPGLDLHLHLPSGYPHIHSMLPRWVLFASGASLALVASVLGGTMGTRFHTRLERRILKVEAERREARSSFTDLREAIAEPSPPPPTMPDVMGGPVEGLPAHS